MQYRLALATLLACTIGTSIAAAQDYDQIKTTTGLTAGVIKEMSPVQVVVEQTAGPKTLQVNDIEWIKYQNEPRELSQARADAVRGAYEDALKNLAKIDPTGVQRQEIKQDIEFYGAYARSKLALAGQGDVTEAGRQINAFLSGGKGSYHYLAANEMLGDLLASAGRFDQAERFYSEVAKAPWPDYKMRANLSVGRALLAQNKPAEAEQKFDEVLSLQGEGRGAELAKLQAKVGKADALSATGKPQDAVKLIEEVIQAAPADAPEVYARGYNALGASYRKLNQPKEALLAYLHVPVLFSAYPEIHAEALANLQTLWLEVNQADRAKEAESLLKERYPNSRWVKQ